MTHRHPQPDPATPPIRVGIAGLGRSGWNIHTKTLGALPGHFRVVAIADNQPTRREEAAAEWGCRTYTTTEALIDDDGLDLLVVATPNLLHAQHAMAALRAGCHVVIEKPIATDTGQADAMIAAAAAAGRVLAPFHNRRYEAHFHKVCELIRSGTLGRVVQARMCWHQFTRRWDWQAIRAHGGGLLNVNGTHLIDQALQLLGPGDVEVWCDLQRVLSSGDADDHVKMLLRGDGPTIDIELSYACGYPQDRWLVMGTHGTLRGTTEQLTWKTVDWSRMPERPLEHDTAAVGRAYPHENITWITHHWKQSPDEIPPYDAFYLDLYATLTRGAPLVITPQSVRRTIDVLRRGYADAGPITPAPAMATPQTPSPTPGPTDACMPA